MAGIAPEVTEKKNPVQPGDRWITKREDGQPVERVRNAAGDGWDEVLLAADMPQSLLAAHEQLERMFYELRETKKLVPKEAPIEQVAARVQDYVRAQPKRVYKPCGCGKATP